MQGGPAERLTPAGIRQVRALIRDTNRLARVLTEAESLRMQLIAMVAHEMRSPLASVLGFSEVLIEPAAGLPAEHVRPLQVIHRQASKLASLVDDLVVAGRLDANQLDYAFTPMPLCPLVEEVIVETSNSRLQSTRAVV